MKNNIKNVFSIVALFGLFSSCVNDTFEDPKQDDCVNSGLVKTKEVSDIYAVAISPTTTPPSIIPNTPIYAADDIIEAYVISSDEGGNFYKKMYLQPTDGSKGFILSIDEVNVYTKYFEPGKKVFVKLKGLAYANPSSFDRGLTFGAPPTSNFFIDRLSNYKGHLIASCESGNEEVFVKHLTISQALSDVYLNTLVEISDVQFKQDCSTYSKKDFDTSLKITNGITTTTLDVRTSRFANFAGSVVPSGRGTIRGVLAKYGSGYQLVLRNERDVKMTGPRMQVVSLPKGGSAITYDATLNEGFTSYATTTTGTVFPKYINDVVVGYKYWDVTSFGTTKYLQASAFNNGCTKAYFVVPVNFALANGFSFKSKDGFNDGDPLKVYYSTDYIPGGNMSQATLVDITSKFVIATGSKTGYATNFIDSGTYVIPASLGGNGYFIFEYDGTTGKTTTIQLDDIVIN
ncbi:DUF5689 domain-containing protein [Flavobacterium sp.]|uniref:DUF5689 domain-containing protein n=1 Tax=Flavobacterium sp. TaxID=239 RepID=UPI0037513A12